MDIQDCTNSELEEMGIPLQCECRSTYTEYDNNIIYVVCVDCDAFMITGRRVAAWV